ncbi:MAG: SRPBCC family protein [Nocardioides sp.]
MAMKVDYYIDAPVESVFDFFKDPTSDTGFSKMEVLESKTTKEGIGTYLSWRVKLGGIPWEGFEVITDLVPNRRISEKSSSAMVGSWEYTFEPEGSGTRLTMEHRPRSLWALPPLGNVIDYGTTRMSRLYIERVRAALKAQTALPSQRKPAATETRKQATTR